VVKRILVPPPRSDNVYALVMTVNVERHPIAAHSSGANALHIRVCAPNAFGSLKVIDCAVIVHKVIKIDVGSGDKGIMYMADMPKFYEEDYHR